MHARRLRALFWERDDIGCMPFQKVRFMSATMTTSL